MGRLAAYFRTSNEDVIKRRGESSSSMSIQNQRKLVHAYIQSHPDLAQMEVVEFYDDGYTGTSFDRPEFQSMMDHAKRGEISCIIVKDLSRFGRDYIEMGEYMERVLPYNHIRLIAVNEGFDSLQYAGKTGGMDTALHNLIYSTYSLDLSVKVRSAMTVRMEHGGYVSCAPYGYLRGSKGNKHTLVLDPVAAPIVRDIFLMIIAGKKTTQVAKELNSRGIPTPLVHKGVKKPASCSSKRIWSHYNIINIVRNPKYMGVMVNHTRASRHIRDKNQRRIPPEEWIVTEGAHEPIVTKDEFDLANARIRKLPKGTRPSDPSIDRVFYCGHCGRKLTKSVSGNTFYCDTYLYLDDAVCRDIRWSKAALEDALLPIYKAQIGLLGEKAHVLNQEQELSTCPERYIRQLDNLERSIASCESEKLQKYEDYRGGRMTREAFIAEKDLLTQRKARLEAEHAKISSEYLEFQSVNEARQGRSKEIDQYISIAASDPIAQKQEMYLNIDRVVVYNTTSLDVHWKFDDLFGDQLENQTA